jgi:hypothetical protein
MIESKQKAICHTAPSILLYRSSRSRCSLRRQGRASIFALPLRTPPIVIEWLLVRALPTKCRVGHCGETNPMLSEAGTSARSREKGGDLLCLARRSPMETLPELKGEGYGRSARTFAPPSPEVLVEGSAWSRVRCAFRFIHGQGPGQDREFDPGERDEPKSAPEFGLGL